MLTPEQELNNALLEIEEIYSNKEYELRMEIQKLKQQALKRIYPNASELMVETFGLDFRGKNFRGGLVYVD